MPRLYAFDGAGRRCGADEPSAGCDVDWRAGEVEAQLNEPVRPAAAAITPTVPETEVPGLPKFVRRYQFGNWKWIAPSVHLRPIALPYDSDTRVFLLQVRSGDQDASAHSHRDRDDLCPLRSVSARTAAIMDQAISTWEMRRSITSRSSMGGQDCICLVAMQGELRLNGLLGRIMQPFVRL